MNTKFNFFLLLLLYTNVTFSNSLDSFKEKFKLLPYPQQVQLLAGSGINPKKIKSGIIQSKISQSIDIPSEEGYILEISDNQVLITAKSAAGVFYGKQTLNQLIDDANEQKINIPALKIIDYPNLSVRAVHIDVKHHLSKLSYYYDLIDRYAQIKINTIIFEFEDKIKYNAPHVGASHAYSIEDFAKLSRYAFERHIQISPLVQGLGHASFILKHEQYKSLRDNPNSDWAFDPMNEETYKLQFSLYDDAIKATPYGKYLHVGGDEIGGIGMSELAKKSGKSQLELQLHWLNKVVAYAKTKNRIPIIWDDNLFNNVGLFQSMRVPRIGTDEANDLWKRNEGKLNEVINLFPKDCIYMRWSYHYPNTQGNKNALAWFKKHNLKVMTATAAQASWALLPRNSSNFNAIKGLTNLSSIYNIDGILCTVWDDASPHYETTWRGIYNTASLAWNYVDYDVKSYNNTFRQRFYGSMLGDSKFEFQDSLEKALVFWEGALSNKGNRSGYPYKIDLIDLPEKENAGEWSKKYATRLIQANAEIDRYNRIRDKIALIKKHKTRNAYAIAVMDETNNMQIYSSKLLLALAKFDQRNPGDDLNKELKKLDATLKEFKQVRMRYEDVFLKTRVPNPSDYFLDSNGHKHLAAGTLNSDWMFVYEIALLKKLDEWKNSKL